MRFYYNLDEYIEITLYPCGTCKQLPKLKKYDRYPWKNSEKILNLSCECSHSPLEIIDREFKSMVELLVSWNKIHRPEVSI